MSPHWQFFIFDGELRQKWHEGSHSWFSEFLFKQRSQMQLQNFLSFLLQLKQCLTRHDWQKLRFMLGMNRVGAEHLRQKQKHS